MDLSMAPAFPVMEVVGGRPAIRTRGMPLCMYLAAHAPEVPEWFVHVPVNDGVVNSARDQMARLVQWRHAYAAAMCDGAPAGLMTGVPHA